MESNISNIVEPDVAGTESFNILFWNCSGYRLGATHLQYAIEKYDIHALMLNETWWRHHLNLRGFD